MKKIIPFLFIVLFFSFCQNTKTKQGHNLKFSFQTDSLLTDTSSVSLIIDSLKFQVLNAPSDTLAINYLNDLSFYWRKPAAILASEALDQSKKINYLYGQTEAILKLGYNYRRSANFKVSDSLLLLALKLSTEQRTDELRSKILIALGDLRIAQARFNEANDYLKEALPITIQLKQEQAEALGLFIMGENYRMQYMNDSARIFLNQSMEAAKKIDDKVRVASCLGSLGDIYVMEFNLDKALEYLLQSFEISKAIKDKSRIAFCAFSVGKVYSTKGDYKAALENLNIAYNAAEELGDRSRMGEVCKAFGFLYRTQKEHKKAIEFLDRSIALFEEVDNKRNVSSALAMLGEVYHDIKEDEKAMQIFFGSLKLCEEINNQKQIATTLSSIAEMYREKKDYANALDYFTRSLKLSDETMDAANRSYCLKCMTDLYMSLNDFKKARECAEGAAVAAKESEILYEMMDAEYALYRIYDTLKLSDKALKAFVAYSSLKDSTTNENQIRSFASAEYAGKEERLKTEQLAKEKVFKAEQARKEEEIKRQKTTRNFFIVGFVLIGALAFVIYRSLRQNKKDKAIIQEQKKLVEEKQKEMTDSITYAKRLQEAILPSWDLVRFYLPDSFVLYKPKDIVAGDFYWFYPISKTEVLLAAADCTGHGVPGAMVSVVCSNALDRAVKEFEIKEPGKILDKVRELVIETFEKSDKNVKDGMDISLAKFEIGSASGEVKIHWAGANNPLWYIQEGLMKKIVADKQPIGKYDKETFFTTHELVLKKNDMLYLFTDGYADQFGGTEGKKLKYKPLEEYIHSGALLSIQEQKEELCNKFEFWKGKYEQVDDVCIIGVRI